MRKSLASTAIVGALLFSVSCGDNRTSLSTLTAPPISRTVITGGGPGAPVPGTCTTNNAIEAEINAVVPPGTNRGSVHGDFGKMVADVNKNDITGAHALAYSITKLLIQLYKAHSLTGTQAQAAKLINDLFCYSGLAITVTDPANASVINPTDASQVVLSSTGTVGSSLPSGAVTEPTVLQFVPIPDTYGGGGHGPLNTKLDQYGGFVAITSSSTTGAPLAKPVVVAVCPPPGMDATVRARLRLGHQASTGFTITPPADASFLTCPTSLGEVQSKMPKWIQSLASIVLPKAAYAKMPFFAAGGVGGTAGEFSPFDPVDPVLSFSSGGVGGTAGEFTRIPKAPAPLPPAGPVKPTKNSSAALQLLTPGARVNTVIAGVCTDTAAVWGGALERECSPHVLLTTHLGTKLSGVPITWAIGIGGGTVAVTAASPWACGAFSGVANGTTDANGESHICWTMGGTPGLNNNSVVATPGSGGDAPAGVTFVPATGTFTASALRRTPTAAATGLSIAFDNAAHPGSGTCSDGLTPALTYSGDGTVPKNAGTFTLTVTCGDGNVFYNTVIATASIVITPIMPTVAVTCPATVVYNGAAQTPCSVSVTSVGLSLTPDASYSNNTSVGTATASYHYAGGGNYLASAGSATFTISGFNFSDSFETESGWTATGFWNRSTLLNGAGPIVNSLFPTYVDLAPGDASNGALPAPFTGSYAFWYGDPATGNYRGAQNSGDFLHSGGMSASANSGTLTSPNIALPSVSGASLILRFNSWFDIESVNPSSFDLMKVSVQDVVTGSVTQLGVLNPASDPPSGHGGATPLTSGGYNLPPVWVEVVQDLTAFSGRTVRLIYSFDTRDVQYNGFRGWIVDNVRVAAEGTSASANRLTRPRTLGGSSQPNTPTVTLQAVPAQKIRPMPQP